MENSNVRKGSIRIIDTAHEINIPDISNQVGYFVSLLHRSGFTSAIIESNTNTNGNPVDKFSFRLNDTVIRCYVTNSSYRDLVSYDFQLIVHEVGFNWHQTGVILDHIMSLVLYGESTSKKEMLKEIMNGTKVSQNKLLITKY